MYDSFSPLSPRPTRFLSDGIFFFLENSGLRSGAVMNLFCAVIWAERKISGIKVYFRDQFLFCRFHGPEAKGVERFM